MRRPVLILVAALLAAPACTAAAQPGGVDVAAFLKYGAFKDIKVSPKGDHLAATVPMEDHTGMIILDRAAGKHTVAFELGKDTHIEGFVWVNPERVLISMSESFGQLDNPQSTVELFAVNVDGSRAENLVGFRVESGGAGTRIQPKQAERVWASLVDSLPDDVKFVIVGIPPEGDALYTRAEGHGFYTEKRRLEYYAQLLDFLSRHIGGAKASAVRLAP